MFNLYPYTNLEDMNLDYILKTIKKVFDDATNLNDWRIEHEAEYEQLKQLYDDFMAGNFPPALYDQLYQWSVENSASIFESLAKMVFFGITDEGYFVAYIPESWEDIIFGTSGLDTTIVGLDYGHLILSY